jgi:hypothetical protein
MSIQGVGKTSVSPISGPMVFRYGEDYSKVESVGTDFISLNDVMIFKTGFANIGDGLRDYFSATSTESLNDAERRWLLAQPGVTGGSINDMWRQLLDNGGFNTRLEYWNSL